MAFHEIHVDGVVTLCEKAHGFFFFCLKKIKARTLAGQILTVTGKYCTILRYMSFIFIFFYLMSFFGAPSGSADTHTQRSTDTHSSQIVVVAYSDIIDWI